MNRKIVLFIMLTFLLSACGAVGDGDIEIHDPWVRPTAQGENAAVYFRLHNHSQSADELIGASSSVSDNVEIHESKVENDVMQMNMISSIPLDVDEEVIFAPGTYHIMLVDIKQEFKAGYHISLTLHFKNHEDIPVNVSVENTPANGEEYDHTE